jgi:replicative DNA helicase
MQITTIGLDIAKNVFQVHEIDAAEKVIVRKRLRRRLVEAIAKVTRLNPESPESAFAMLGQREVFADLCEFHPSLLTAITLCWTRH